MTLREQTAAKHEIFKVQKTQNYEKRQNYLRYRLEIKYEYGIK